MDDHSPDWYAGARAEHDLHNEGLSVKMVKVRSHLEGLARLRKDLDEVWVLAAILCVYSADRPLRERVRLAWSILRKKLPS